MRSHVLMAVALLGVMDARVALSDVIYDDAAVSREFIYTKGFFCGNDRPIKSSLNWILTTCCHNDTNRYVRVAKETASTNDSVMAMAVRIVRQHGGSQDVPFLYACTNNPTCVAGALTAILQLGGLTQEAVGAASVYIAGTNTYHVWDRNDVACELFRAAAVSPTAGNLKDIAASNALCFASNSSDVRYNDMGFKAADPSYKYSKRRLSVLRSVLPLCQGCEVLMNYTTNAINGLVSYPESALPD